MDIIQNEDVVACKRKDDVVELADALGIVEMSVHGDCMDSCDLNYCSEFICLLTIESEKMFVRKLLCNALNERVISVPLLSSLCHWISKYCGLNTSVNESIYVLNTLHEYLDCWELQKERLLQSYSGLLLLDDISATRKHSRIGYTLDYLTLGIETRLPGAIEGEEILESNVVARVLELNVLCWLKASLAYELQFCLTNVLLTVCQMVRVLSRSIGKIMDHDKKKIRYVEPFGVLNMLENKSYLCQDEYGLEEVLDVTRLVVITPRLPSIR